MLRAGVSTKTRGAPDFEQALRHLMAWLATEAPRHGVALSVLDETGTVTPVAFSQSHEMRQFLRWLTDRTPTASQSVLDRLPSLIRQYGNQYRIVLLVPASERAVYEIGYQPLSSTGLCRRGLRGSPPEPPARWVLFGAPVRPGMAIGVGAPLYLPAPLPPNG